MRNETQGNQLLNKKIKDYSFITAFFLIFSFFVFFAIKPNLETAVKLQKELGQLKVVNTNYNTAISRILVLQTALEEHREELPLLDQALPNSPQVNTLLSDLQKSASASGIVISKLSIAEVNLKNTKATPGLKNYSVLINSSSQFSAVQAFMDSFLSQRRLKLIKKLDLEKADQQASSSGTLNVSFQIEGYYL